MSKPDDTASLDCAPFRVEAYDPGPSYKAVLHEVYGQLDLLFNFVEGGLPLSVLRDAICDLANRVEKVLYPPLGDGDE